MSKTALSEFDLVGKARLTRDRDAGWHLGSAEEGHAHAREDFTEPASAGPPGMRSSPSRELVHQRYRGKDRNPRAHPRSEKTQTTQGGLVLTGVEFLLTYSKMKTRTCVWEEVCFFLKAFEKSSNSQGKNNTGVRCGAREVQAEHGFFL